MRLGALSDRPLWHNLAGCANHFRDTADGRRFLVNKPMAESLPSLNVITNWQQLLSPTRP